jgi:hypothetical protein
MLENLKKAGDEGGLGESLSQYWQLSTFLNPLLCFHVLRIS